MNLTLTPSPFTPKRSRSSPGLSLPAHLEAEMVERSHPQDLNDS